MTGADCIAREECEDPLGPLAWLMPLVVLFQSLVLMFTNLRGRLGEMRRARRLPRDWQAHYERLRQAEWPIVFLLSEGARQLLTGHPLDLRTLPDPGDAPDWFRPAMPRTALAMHLRIDAIARFNAEPERYVQRHAERIALEASRSASVVECLIILSAIEDGVSKDEARPKPRLRVLFPP
ncbi:MAG: hypothetical protein Q8R02_07445 [Hyphomonadaceae bacterium]|nr:hypothetical protein [Hyphomonadaceae bacterium]